MAVATTDPVRLPPALPVPRYLQAIPFVLARGKTIAWLRNRYGTEFMLDVPALGKTMVVSDPVVVKDMFTTNSDLIGRAGALGLVLGPGSTFSLEGDAHRARRKLLVPPFHGKRMAAYEDIVEQETIREIASWAGGVEFATLESFMRITLNAILRAVFGAAGDAFAELRELLPRFVMLGSRMAVMPPIVRRDYGSWSPWGRMLRYRRRYDEIIAELIADALADPAFEDRQDVLSLMLRARYEDGSRISDDHVADELLTLLAAGHETTATTLGWAVERLRRHPALLARLTEEVDAGESALRQATIYEVQRTRPVIDGAPRRTKERLRLGDWVLPAGYSVFVSIQLSQASEQNFPNAATFDPDRFIGSNPDNHTWIPFGGGVRRCIGAAFANMEMDVVLRTLLREYDFEPTAEPDEPVHSRGIANAPGRGGLAVLRRRGTAAQRVVRAGEVADIAAHRRG
ncbi:cytochrome P450 [Aldersonia sp. NBC_00410]|uniref:cytochrome P450 n=1 Tax=Aldersonia sp. NBC_00410 TaxID=2975954 RepID=UPI0022599FAC|nr:cytochrome P450 [Aldersonia sp. NBC_00410]MCX5042715.1 cytochrome P450 [Aldersonia sp. NBC_00410]